MIVHHVDELDDSTPTLVVFETVNAVLARAIADSFPVKAEKYLLECGGKRYRPFLVEQPKPGWWRVKACLLSLPTAALDKPPEAVL